MSAERAEIPEGLILVADEGQGNGEWNDLIGIDASTKKRLEIEVKEFLRLRNFATRGMYEIYSVTTLLRYVDSRHGLVCVMSGNGKLWIRYLVWVIAVILG